MTKEVISVRGSSNEIEEINHHQANMGMDIVMKEAPVVAE
jgi:hypothetical protein